MRAREIRTRLLVIASPTWSGLRRLGESRLLRSSYIWIVVVPLAARLLSKVDPDASISACGVPIDLRLPFSWKLFFFGSLATSVGNAIYSIWCPGIVKQHASFTDFSGQGKGTQELQREFAGLIAGPGRRIEVRQMELNVGQFLRRFCRPPKADEFDIAMSVEPQLEDNVKRSIMISYVEEPSMIIEERLPSAFWSLWHLADELGVFARRCAAIFFWIGLILFGLVALQNVCFVIRRVLEGGL